MKWRWRRMMWKRGIIARTADLGTKKIQAELEEKKERVRSAK